MSATRLGVLLGALLIVALVPTALAAALPVEVEAEASASLDAPIALPEPVAEQAATYEHLLPDAVQETLEPLSVVDVSPSGAQARIATPGAAAGHADGRAAGAQAQAAAEVFVRSLPEPVREAAPPALAAAGILALLQAFGGFRLAGLGGIALYSRITKSDLLDNAHRDAVYKLVQETPGIAMSEIGARLGLGWGTVVYHLDRLERAGFVTGERSGAHRCIFPVGTVPRSDRQAIGTLKADTTRNLAVYLVSNPGASQTQVCEALGLSASAASKQVSKLETAGLVRREREWKTVHLYPEPTLGALLTGETAAPAHAHTTAGLVAPIPA